MEEEEKFRKIISDFLEMFCEFLRNINISISGDNLKFPSIPGEVREHLIEK